MHMPTTLCDGFEANDTDEFVNCIHCSTRNNLLLMWTSLFSVCDFLSEISTIDLFEPPDWLTWQASCKWIKQYQFSIAKYLDRGRNLLRKFALIPSPKLAIPNNNSQNYERTNAIPRYYLGNQTMPTNTRIVKNKKEFQELFSKRIHEIYYSQKNKIWTKRLRDLDILKYPTAFKDDLCYLETSRITHLGVLLDGLLCFLPTLKNLFPNFDEKYLKEFSGGIANFGWSFTLSSELCKLFMQSENYSVHGNRILMHCVTVTFVLSFFSLFAVLTLTG